MLPFGIGGFRFKEATKVTVVTYRKAMRYIMDQRSSMQDLREQVADTDLCTGCGACVNLCPYYAAYEDRIVVLDECKMVDGACIDICPRMPGDQEEIRRLLFNEKDITPEMGAVKAFFVARAADARVRANAQHGGTVTALVNLALDEGLIDTAILAGAGEHLLPAAMAITDDSEAMKVSKSRFVVSPNVAKFNELVKGKAKSIGVVATPCQALALAKMRVSRNQRLRENSKKLQLVIGLFCGWTFKWAALKEVLRAKVDIDSIVGMDIPPSQYHSLEVHTTNGTVSISLDEVQKCVRSSCLVCNDMTAEYSDISVGSARLPEGWEEAKSWNQIVVRTDRGQKLMDLARSKGVLEFRNVPDGNLDRLKKASLNNKKQGDEISKTMA